MMLSLKAQLLERIIAAQSDQVWTSSDFLGLGDRDGVDKALQRLVRDKTLQRIRRGLYIQVQLSSLTNRPRVPDYHQIVKAVMRKHQGRMLVDGMTAANLLGLTTAVAGQVIVHTDVRVQPISLGSLTIQFKLTAPSKLYWADRPAMYIVQALYWLYSRDNNCLEDKKIKKKMARIIGGSVDGENNGEKIRKDLEDGLHTMPYWMQNEVKKFLSIN